MSCNGSRRNSQVSIKNSFAQVSASALAQSASSAVLAASPRASAASTATRSSGLAQSASSAVLASRASSGRRSASSQQKRAPSTNNAETEFEQAIVNATAPIETTETEQVTVGKFSGIFLNKAEVDAFRGPVPISQYTINTECEPEVVKKKADKLKYTQDVSIKYLRPPQAPKPGDIIVREKQSTFPPAPPVIIRQLACQGQDPAPLVFRQKPPKKPACIPEQVVEIEGCPLPPPPRRVIIEKLSALPPKPQAIVVEKWLPYCAQKRRVVFQPSNAQAEYQCRNLLIEWEAPEVEVEKVCKNLGVEDADPEEYERQYGADLKDESELPEVECGCAPQACPGGAAASADGVPELEGDLAALKRVDLEKYGLEAYKKFL